MSNNVSVFLLIRRIFSSSRSVWSQLIKIISNNDLPVAESESSDIHFELFAKTGGKKGIHTRIIWCCSWGHDSKIFCTGSRDSKAVVWSVAESMQEEVSTLSDKVSSVLMLNNESITSCSIAPGYVGGTGSYLIALGCESGHINLYLWSVAAKWSPLQTLKGR